MTNVHRVEYIQVVVKTCWSVVMRPIATAPGYHDRPPLCMYLPSVQYRVAAAAACTCPPSVQYRHAAPAVPGAMVPFGW
jgi:hypothetical protein